MSSPAFAAARVRFPDVPAIAFGVREVAWVSAAGEIETLDYRTTLRRLRDGTVPLVCHARAAARRLQLPSLTALDLLELFAFVRPARFCVPTPRGLAEALLLPIPASRDAEAASLHATVRALLGELTASPREDAAAIARTMLQGGWRWAPSVLAALGAPETAAPSARPADGLKVWLRLKEWEEGAPPPPPDTWPVEPVEARARLVQLLGHDAEARPQQLVYASHAAAAFAPRNREDEPRLVLAEAGTGIGKTLGYVAPASLWARKNHGPVWISTFTRNLQRQLDRELDRAFPDRAEKAQKVVVRKGRENLLCLLNFEEALAQLPMRREDTVALGLVARWALSTRDGDMVGGDFPAWLADLLGSGVTVDLTDTRGECIYGACRHYRRCFVERQIRKARRAEIVVANHALVMVQAARAGEDQLLPTRYVFDEGHQLFDAADDTFSLRLSGLETAELRRWLRGGEAPRRSRRRGLRERAGDLFGEDGAALDALEALLNEARLLPGPGWRSRLTSTAPVGPTEAFLLKVREQAYAHGRDVGSYSIEAGTRPQVPGLLDAAEVLERALGRLLRPVIALSRALEDLRDADAARLDSPARQRIESLLRSLQRRALEPLVGWQQMLRALAEETPAEFVDWLAVERSAGQELDIGLYRHWIDPMRPFAEVVLKPSHGVLVTSATLRDGTGDEDADWAAAEGRTGARHLAAAPVLSALASPFDYEERTRVLVVGDVDREDPRQVAAAYRELFVASGGGALGLFTAISRLRAVYDAIVRPLEEAGIKLLAQHIDPLDTGTLIDIFRAEEDSCLLGTDAVRDGIDVPGRALRLIVFDRVPWPRPSLLHRARRDAFGGRAYDEMLTRLKLKQAFGRLIRRAGDRGLFIMLDRQLPSRLAGAFPEGVEVQRIGLAEAVRETAGMLGR